MSWMRALYDTYDNLELQEKEGLLKIAHSTQKAHLEVQLSKDGKMIADKLSSSKRFRYSNSCNRRISKP